MIKVIVVGITMIFFTCHLRAQELTERLLSDSIKREVTRFFMREGILQNQQSGVKGDYIYVTEIRLKRAVGYDKNGIYRIGVYQSHSPEHILIKQKKEFRIFKLEEISKALKEVISYSENNNIGTETMFVYIKEVMSMYQENHHTETFRLPKIAD